MSKEIDLIQCNVRAEMENSLKGIKSQQEIAKIKLKTDFIYIFLKIKAKINITKYNF